MLCRNFVSILFQQEILKQGKDKGFPNDETLKLLVKNGLFNLDIKEKHLDLNLLIL